MRAVTLINIGIYTAKALYTLLPLVCAVDNARPDPATLPFL